MTKYLLVLFLAVVLLGCNGDKSVSPDPVVNLFVGSWLVENGGGTWVFGDTSLVVGTYIGTYSFDSTTSPKSIDIHLTGAVPNPSLGIYQFINDTTLVIKVPDFDGVARPTAFADEAHYDILNMHRQQ